MIKTSQKRPDDFITFIVLTVNLLFYVDKRKSSDFRLLCKNMIRSAALIFKQSHCVIRMCFIFNDLMLLALVNGII